MYEFMVNIKKRIIGALHMTQGTRRQFGDNWLKEH
jgi:hypothetical protein